ncbi:hypothetical protein TcCL_NonESM08452 [Trypanosoma cruzi]|nr:hypothetical protein TcCL_NonESM08452 [Trypanosoma cruzi]
MRADLLHPYCSRQHLHPFLKQKVVAAALMAVAVVTDAIVAAVAVVQLLAIVAFVFLPVLYFVFLALFFLDLDHLLMILLNGLKGFHLHPPLQEQHPVVKH